MVSLLLAACLSGPLAHPPGWCPPVVPSVVPIAAAPLPPAYPFPHDAVLGWRVDPLAAYDDLAAKLYPLGIPPEERGAALQILREARLRQAVGPVVVSGIGSTVGPAIGPAAGPAVLPPATPLIGPAGDSSPGTLPVPPEPILVEPITRGETVDGLHVRLRLPAAESGSLTLIVVGNDRDLIPVAGGRLFESPRDARLIARKTVGFTAGGGTYDIRLPPPNPKAGSTATVFARLRIAGLGIAEAPVATIPLRQPSTGLADTLRSQPRRTVPHVVLSSERPIPQAITP